MAATRTHSVTDYILLSRRPQLAHLCPRLYPPGRFPFRFREQSGGGWPVAGLASIQHRHKSHDASLGGDAAQTGSAKRSGSSNANRRVSRTSLQKKCPLKSRKLGPAHRASVMLAQRPGGSLSRFLDGMVFAVSMASPTAFTIGQTGCRQCVRAYTAMYPSVRIGNNRRNPGKADSFQDILARRSIPVLICFEPNLQL